MNVTVEDLSSIKKKLTIEVPSAQVAEAIEAAFVKAGRSARLKGFRPGKVPRAVLEQHFGAKVEVDVAEELIKDSYFKAIMDKQLPAVGQPKIVDMGEVSKEAPFRFEAEVEVKPEITVEHYRGLELERERDEFDASRVEQQIEQMLQSRAVLEPVERDAAQTGDFVVIDFVGRIDGEAFDNGSATDYGLELGSNTFIPGFEDGIVGMAKGETRTIDLKFPESYGAEDLAGKDVSFEVVLKEIKHKVPPELTDELAKEFGSDSVEALRERIHGLMEGEEQSRIRHEFEDAVRAKLVELNPIEVPEVMVEGQLEAMFGNFTNNLRQQGMSVEMLGMTRERFDEVYHEAAASRVKSSLILEAIGRQEEIKAEEADLEAKMKQLAERTGTDETVVRNHFLNPDARRSLYIEVFEEKVLDFVVEAGTVRELSAEEAKAKKEAAAQN